MHVIEVFCFVSLYEHLGSIILEKYWRIVHAFTVTCSWKEPFPGWVDGYSLISSVLIEIGRGTVRSFLSDGTVGLDLIPIDVVVNSLITAAWYSHTYKYVTFANVVRVFFLKFYVEVSVYIIPGAINRIFRYTKKARIRNYKTVYSLKLENPFNYNPQQKVTKTCSGL